MALSMTAPETDVKAETTAKRLRDFNAVQLVAAVVAMRREQDEAKARTAPYHDIPDTHSWAGIGERLGAASGMRSADAGEHADDALRDVADLTDGWHRLATQLQRYGADADDLLGDVDAMLRRGREGHMESACRHEQRALRLAAEILAVERRRGVS